MDIDDKPHVCVEFLMFLLTLADCSCYEWFVYPVLYWRRCPRVEAGKNTSSVIPASRKRRRRGNPVVSNETAMYDYESSATLTTDSTTNYRPVLSSERAPQDKE
jgi:hypothetical protein